MKKKVNIKEKPRKMMGKMQLGRKHSLGKTYRGRKLKIK